MNATLQIRTADGYADAYVAHPSGPGPWPGVLFFMDAFGMRPALFAMAGRLASHGYYVLVPNMYYRKGAFAPFDPKATWTRPDETARIMTMIHDTDEDSAMRDVRSFLHFMSHEGHVRGRKIGVVGYCMGGGFALRAACEYPDSIAAAASFHGSRFVVNPRTPDLLAAKLRASVHLGVAEHDRSHDEAVTKSLLTGLERARVPHSVETYPGTSHGFAISDLSVFDANASETHWTRLLALFGSAL